MNEPTCDARFTLRGVPKRCALRPGHIGSTNGEHDDRPPASPTLSPFVRRALDRDLVAKVLR